MKTPVRSVQQRWGALQKQLGAHLSERLFQELANQPNGEAAPGSAFPGGGVALAYLGATLVYAMSLAFGGLGVWMLIKPLRTVLDPVGGVVSLLLCLASRPRLVPPPSYIVARSDYPALYAITDRIAAAMHTPPPHGIAVSADFSANYRQAGWRGRPYVELGAPLMAVLDDDERVAIIAHELSHGANRDPLRGRVLHGALQALLTWSAAIRPLSIGTLGKGMAFGPLISLLAIPVELAMLAASELLFLVARGFMLLVLRQSQRAEYLADRLAASVAGSDAMQRALEKTYLADVVDAAVRTHALTTPDEPLGGKMATAIAGVTPSRIAALRAESRASLWQVDTTHPPTALRVELLQAAHVPKLAGLAGEEDLAALSHEVGRMVADRQREMINRKLEAAFG